MQRRARNSFLIGFLVALILMTFIVIILVSKMKAINEAKEALAKVDAQDLLYKQLGKLSGGELQRVLLSLALTPKPDILLLDEPTTSLDPVSASEVFNVLSSLKNQNMTIVLVTHNIDFARAISDRIIFMSNGRICEQGTPSELIDFPKSQQTRMFINHCVNMVYEIHSEKYDHPELNARIEVFCMRYRLNSSGTYSLQLAVEELLNLIPLNDGVTLVITKSHDYLELEAVLAKGEHPYLSPECINDELSFDILKGLCESISEEVNHKNETIIKLKIKQNTI